VVEEGLIIHLSKKNLKTKFIEMIHVLWACPRAYSGGSFGGLTPPPFLRKFFQFARVIQEKNAKPPPPNFPVHTKNFKTPPSKNFWIRPKSMFYKGSSKFLYGRNLEKEVFL